MPWIVELAPGQTIGAGLEYGFGTEGIPAGARQVGKQKDWLQTSQYGPDTRGFLKKYGLDIDDVGEDPVYEVPNADASGSDFLVPFGKWYANAKYNVRWTRLRYREDVTAKAKQTAQEARDRVRALNDRLAQLDAEEEVAAAEAKIKEREARIAAIKSGAASTTPNTTGTPTTAGLRTYEVFGLLNGSKVPLTQAVVFQNGRYVFVPGGQAMATDNPGEGFGLAGIPGGFGVYHKGESPTSYGQDPDKAVMGWTGTRGYAIPASTLTQMFGNDWRTKIY
jgi:hypothetical protein